MISLWKFVKSVAWSTEDGSLTQLYAAVNIKDEKITGKYFHPIAQLNEPSKLVHKENQRKLWKFSLECLKSS